MLKFCLYLLSFPLVFFALDSVNINGIFKKNKMYQARIFYVIAIFSLSYLLANFLYDFVYMIG